MKYFSYILSLLFAFTANAQTELIVNGNFSTPNTAWVKTGNFQYDSRFSTYHSPPAYSYLADFAGQAANNISGILYQDFFVPAGTGSITIKLWYRITTQEVTTTNPFDTCRITLVDPSNSANNIFLRRLSNLDKNASYSLFSIDVASLQVNRTWRLHFSGATDGGLPTVFRIDDVSVLANPPNNPSCIIWVNNIPPTSQTVDSAMQVLCNYGIIAASQNASSLSSLISRIEIARCLGKALFGNTAPDFMDNFPNIFPALESLPISDQRYVKLMLYLEYRSGIAPLTGNDDISPFSREYFYPNWNGETSKSDALKAILETWDLKPSMIYYDPCGSSYSPIICDMLVSYKNLGWVQRAHVLGLLGNNITSPCGAAVSFGPDNPITYSQFYVSLARILNNPKPPVGYDDLFIPNIFYTKNLNNNISLERGVFHEYSDNGFDIPSGGVGLHFGISYHSNLTEIPILNNDIETENKFLKGKLQPLGGGWTHSYNSYIKILDNIGSIPNKILIYWPDGTMHSFLVPENRYETKGLNDKLTIDSYNGVNHPSQITIKKGRNEYLFKNIDQVGYCVLSLVKITEAHGHSDTLMYVPGYATVSGYEPKILSRVKDSYSGRSLYFTYWPNSNYLKNVKDTLNRFLNYFPNQCTQELDSSTDAKNQTTRYDYKRELGTFAYRTYLLTGITRPNGNQITNNYKSRKITQTQGGNYIIKVDAVPDYQSPWTQQNSTVTATQNNQNIISNYVFDAIGNPIKTTTETGGLHTVYDTLFRPIIERDTIRGFLRKFRYDANGYIDKIVTIDSLFTDSTVYEYVNNQYGEIQNLYDYNDPTTSARIVKFNRNSSTGDPLSIVEFENTSAEIKHTFQYNANGLVATYISPTGHNVGLNYNVFGNVQTVTKYPMGAGSSFSESFEYDAASKPVRHTNYENEETTYAYDANDNPFNSIINPTGLNLKTENNFDGNENIINIKSPKNHNTVLKYNFFTDDLIEENDGTNKKNWAYNSNGSLDSFITKNNHQFKYLYYNPIDNPGTTLSGLLFSDNLRFYQYWPNKRELYRISNSAGKLHTFWYDSRERGKWAKPSLMSSSGFFTGPADNMYYEYDRMGRPTVISYPGYGGKNYDFNNYYDYLSKQLLGVENINTNYKYVIYSYQKDSKPTKEIYGNGDTIFHHYDSYNREDSIWAINKFNVLLYSIGFKLDKNGKHTEENTRIFYQGSEVTTLPNLPIGQILTGTYELRNRIQDYGGVSYTSDASGNISSSNSPPVTYTYSPGYEELTNINRNGTNTVIEYDALGFRRRLNNTYYVVDWQNTGNVVMEAQQNTTPINVFVYGRGLVSRIDPISDSVFYYHYDARGSVIAITNQAGQLVKFYQYDEFGTIYNEGGNLTWNNAFRYLGKHAVQSDNPDLYYMKARYYQPSTGRFIKEDPIWETNLFTYANNDPINNIDPDGRFFETILDIVSIGYSTYEFYKNPSWKNLGMLTWDIGAAFLPFVPGSYIKRGTEIVAIADELNRSSKIVNEANKGWRVGEPFTNLTAKGNSPAWGTVRQRVWKNEGLLSSPYTESNFLRMNKGLAPQYINPKTGLLESMELHHTVPQRDGGLYEFIKVTREEHSRIDPFRRIKK